MARQYFSELSAEPPIANLTAITATTETALWDPARFSPIAANEAKAGKVWRLTAGGIVSTDAGASTLIITPRFGLTVGAGISMGVSVTQTAVPSLTDEPWHLDMMLVCRTVGAPGVNSTVIGTGSFRCSGTAASAGSGFVLAFGGVSATVDVSIATGVLIGWTLSVAGTVTPMYAALESLN